MTVAEVELLTIRQVARRLKCSTRTVLRWIYDGKVPATKPGGDRMGWRVRADDLEDFIERGNTVP